MHTPAITCSTTDHQSAFHQFLQKGNPCTRARRQPVIFGQTPKWWGSDLWGSHRHTPLLNLEVTLVWWFGGQRFYVIWKSGSRETPPAYCWNSYRKLKYGEAASQLQEHHVLVQHAAGQQLAHCWGLSAVTVCLKCIYKIRILILRISYLFPSFLRQRRCLSSH